jgi:hypothetical protein
MERLIWILLAITCFLLGFFLKELIRSKKKESYASKNASKKSPGSKVKSQSYSESETWQKQVGQPDQPSTTLDIYDSNHGVESSKPAKNEEVNQYKPTVAVEPEVSRDFFYLTLPFSDNTFNYDDAVKEPSPKSLYLFKGVRSGTFSLYLDHSPALNAPLSSHTTYFARACDYANSYDPSVHRGLENVESGEFVVDGSNVKVIKRPVIRFI